MLLSTLLALTLCSCATVQDPAAASASPHAGGQEQLLAEFAAKGVNLDLERGLIELHGFVCQRYEPLEYLVVVQPQGKDHESLFYVQEVSAEALNAAMLLTGVQQGHNGTIVPKEPPPTMEEMQAGVPGFSVDPAGGDGFYVYAAWEMEGEDGEPEHFLYRAEDLIIHSRDERTYDRGRWVYLGSRFIRPHKDAPEMFAAEDGNLVSLCYFNPANHLLTGADREAENQYVWYPNLFLMPEVGHPVRILFSRAPLEGESPRVSGPTGE